MQQLTTPYQTEKKKSILRWYGFIDVHPSEKIQKLADIIDNLERINTKERRIVLLVRGLETADKQELLNCVMTIFAVNMYKMDYDVELMKTASSKVKADAQYAPSSLVTYYCHLFAYLSEKQVYYTSEELRKMKGSFHAALRIKFETTLKERPEYGIRKTSPIDLMAGVKIRESNLTPYKMDIDSKSSSGYDWLVTIIAQQMGEVYMRGGKEV